ncbi:LCP family protein [Nonomuraea endophytica]|uniref:LCP family protein required for cell wall assembly n=1 Tax=Nonomuraea endophytica TaxID=714136 RepID=A0A7W7ZXY5_9ACTN|nr:LCP family protein [Nonomuraea endophytica]MBB5075885.1 LCP family protein required for cell wall assembly [Nonomuraea endophytica]
MAEEDRTRPLRSPGEGRPLPSRPDDGMRSAGAPAQQFPPSPAPAEPPRSAGRVYGRERPGNSPVKPLKARGGGGGEVPPTAVHQGGGGPFNRPPGKPPRTGRRRPIGKIIAISIAGLLVLLLVAAIGMFFWVNSRLTGIPGVLDDYEGRPADTPGTNWLLVGSDSRKGLSAAQRKKLATGRAAGQRTDSMMLLHIPEGSDKATLVSLPRDSAVTIPGKGRNKLNAAYTLGGPKLLVRTLENVTGLRIDNYMEIGFAGFVEIVDAIGGVEINVRADINDPKAGLNLKKGKQELTGGQALGYVRTRKGGALPDFERTKRQRQFLGAVVKKAASPGVLINPFTSIPLAASATDAVVVDESTGAFDMLSLGLSMGDSPVTTVVPFGGNEIAGGGTAVKWDTQKALALFNALKADKPVPKDILDANN